MSDILVALRWVLRGGQVAAVLADIAVAAVATSHIHWCPVERCYDNDDGSTSCYVSTTRFYSFQSGGIDAFPFCGIALVLLIVASLVGRKSTVKGAAFDALLALLWIIGGIVALFDVRGQTSPALGSAMVALAWALAGLSLVVLLVDGLLRYREIRDMTTITTTTTTTASTSRHRRPDVESAGEGDGQNQSPLQTEVPLSTVHQHGPEKTVLA